MVSLFFFSFFLLGYPYRGVKLGVVEEMVGGIIFDPSVPISTCLNPAWRDKAVVYE